MKACPFCGAEARRSIAPAKGHPMGTYIATIRCGNPHCVTVVRCGDCKYSTLPSMQTQIYGKAGTRTCHNKKSPCNRRNVFSDDFCRYGDGKNDADEPNRA